MKATVKTRKTDLTKAMLTMILTGMITTLACAQENDNYRTLLSNDVRISEVWAPEVKINSIQGKTGTLIGFYGGAMFNNNYMLGITGGVNLGHPTVNYGYFGGLGQVILYPGRMVHVSGQMMIAYGTTKDYENPKSGMLDNFWNISGERFQISEPGVNLEVNVRPGVTLVAGVSYRWVTGIDSNNENLTNTHLTNQDMSGVNFNVSMKFAKKQKK
jgi:hypothetical protein